MEEVDRERKILANFAVSKDWVCEFEFLPDSESERTCCRTISRKIGGDRAEASPAKMEDKPLRLPKNPRGEKMSKRGTKKESRLFLK